jgi:hypothetical protein
VVTLRLPEKLREVNRAMEQSAWGRIGQSSIRPCDYKAIREAEQRKQEGK